MGSTTAGNASATIWIISGGLCYRFSFFFGVYVRDDEALHSTIEELQDSGIVVIRNPSDGSDTEYFSSTDHVFNLVQVHWAMFAVNHHEVIVDRAEYFNDVRSESADNCSINHLALSELGLRGISSHG
jgi:hypothetical protein